MLGNRVEINGYIQQEASVGLSKSDEATGRLSQRGKLMSAYSSVQLETNFHIFRNVDFYTILNGWYDQVYNIRSETGSFRGYMPARDYMQSVWDKLDREAEVLREAYIDIHLKHFDIRAGKQQVVWGETDGLRLMDQLNSLDMRREWATRDWEEIRIPKWMIKGEYFLPIDLYGIRDLTLELVWNPGDVKETRFNLDINQSNLWGETGTLDWYAGGGTWGFPIPNTPTMLRRVVTARRRTSSIDNSEFGIRLKGDYKETYFTLDYFQGWDPDGVVKSNGAFIPFRSLGRMAQVLPPQITGQLVSQLAPFMGPDGAHIPPQVLEPMFPTLAQLMPFFNSPLDRNLIDIPLDLEYLRLRMAGFTLSRELPFIQWKTVSPVLRIEWLYSFKQPFNVLGWDIGANKIARKDQIRYMIGFDWPIWLKFLNKRTTFFTSFQFFQFHNLNYNKSLVHPFYDFYGAAGGASFPKTAADGKVYVNKVPHWRIHQDEQYISLLINTKYDVDRILPEILFVTDIKEKVYYLKPRVRFAYGDHWRPEIGALYFKGNGKLSSMDLFNDRDMVYFKVKYQF
jgi:hypothetical protein